MAKCGGAPSPQKKQRCHMIQQSHSWAYTYPNKTIIWKYRCTSVFIAAPFTMAKTWKQPKCPLSDEWIKMWYTYIHTHTHTHTHTMQCYSAIKKQNNAILATLMDLEIIILNEVSQKKTNSIWYHICVESKIWHKWTYLWNRNRLTDLENRLVVAKGEEEGVEWNESLEIVDAN